MDWYGLVWFGLNFEAEDVVSGRLSVGSGRLCGFMEVIWVGGFKIRWVSRTDGWLDQVGKYVRWVRIVGWEG